MIQIELEIARRTALKQFQQIPGVGPRIAQDFWDLGYRSASDLRGKDADALYLDLCRKRGMRVDKSVLYALRCAVYFASHDRPDPRRLKWTYWRDLAEA